MWRSSSREFLKNEEHRYHVLANVEEQLCARLLPEQAYTDGQLKALITNGLAPSGMPAAEGILNDPEIWSLVLYIRHLPAKGSLGEAEDRADDAAGTQ